jgi:MOSC domain-containing protein YiiM
VVVSVNVSAGGVPKLPVRGAAITASGVEGDRQRNLRYHGGPDRAVCIFAAEVIERLRAEGHPIAPGTVGENVTVRGLDWARVVPGARLYVGSVLLEVTGYTAPCRTIAGSFADRRSSRISQKTHPGASRVYARVLRPGRVAAGDAATLLAPTEPPAP